MSNPFESIIGKWQGNSGASTMGSETIPFIESVSVHKRLDATIKTGNQSLIAYPYERLATKQDGSLYHYETGFYLWDYDRKISYRQTAVPRGHQYIGQDPEGGLNFCADITEISESDWLYNNFRLCTYSFSGKTNGNSFEYIEIMDFIESSGRNRHTLTNKLNRTV